MVAVFATVLPHVVLSFLLLRPRKAIIREKTAMMEPAIVAILAALERPLLVSEGELGEGLGEGFGEGFGEGGSVVARAVDGGFVESTAVCKAATASMLVIP